MAERNRWRERCKRVIQIARDAQFEATAEMIRRAAITSVLTPEELESINQRIRAQNDARREAWRAKRDAAARAGKEREG